MGEEEDSITAVEVSEEQHERRLPRNWRNDFCYDLCLLTGQAHFCGCCAFCGSGRRQRLTTTTDSGSTGLRGGGQVLEQQQQQEHRELEVETDDDLQEYANQIKCLAKQGMERWHEHLGCLMYDHGYELEIVLTQDGIKQIKSRHSVKAWKNAKKDKMGFRGYGTNEEKETTVDECSRYKNAY